jgi:hypothetical protein
MRSALVLGILTLTLALANPGTGQANPEIRHVIQPEATVHPYPSERPESYVTNVLKQNDAVHVVEERPDGWLKIIPPEGSFSWINSALLDTSKLPNLYVKDGNGDAPVFVGSVRLKSRPRIIGSKIPAGAQVTSIGPAQRDNEGQWMPIEPPAREYRYIRAEYVSPSVGPTGNRAATPTGRAVDGSNLVAQGAAATAAASTGTRTYPGADSYHRALAAEQAGQLPDAINLYLQAARETAMSDPRQSQLATQRAAYLQQSARNAGNPPSLGQSPAALASARSVLNPTDNGRYYALSGGDPLVVTPTVAPTRTVSTASTTPSPDAVYTGVVRQSRRTAWGRQLCALETVDGRFVCYITDGAGITLHSYIDHVTDLKGQMTYNGELRAWCLVVAQVRQHAP